MNAVEGKADHCERNAEQCAVTQSEHDHLTTRWGVDDELMLSAMSCGSIGKITGVKLWSNGHVRWIRRRPTIRDEQSIFDAIAEREVELQMDDVDEQVEDSWELRPFLGPSDAPVRCEYTNRMLKYAKVSQRGRLPLTMQLNFRSIW